MTQPLAAPASKLADPTLILADPTLIPAHPNTLVALRPPAALRPHAAAAPVQREQDLQLGVAQQHRGMPRRLVEPLDLERISPWPSTLAKVSGSYDTSPRRRLSLPSCARMQ
jgi:hypothetical protein